jgi:hypothetical protein
MGEVRDRERDVELARAKLAVDLAVLRSPKTLSDFTDDLKQEALDTKDAIIDKAKASAQSSLNGLVEDLKAKAAANPAAALAIGAGVAWRVINHPPIATALIGFGLFSLWRTNASRPQNGYQPDYVAQGKARLKEQGADFVSAVSSLAGDAADAVSAKAAELTDTAKDKVQQLSDSVGASMDDLRARVQSNTASAADAARRGAHDLRDQVKTESAQAYAQAGKLVHDGVAAGQSMLDDDDARNKLLLGVAGVAVAAALGIACQKRISSHLEQA